MKTNALKGSFVRGALLGGLLGVFSSSLSAQEKLPVENDLKIISYNISGRKRHSLLRYY